MAEMTDWNAETKWLHRNEWNDMNKEMWCSSSFAASTAVMTKCKMCNFLFSSTNHIFISWILFLLLCIFLVHNSYFTKFHLMYNLCAMHWLHLCASYMLMVCYTYVMWWMHFRVSQWLGIIIRYTFMRMRW